MKRHALQVVGELERRAAAQMHAFMGRARELARKRTALIARIAAERQPLLAAGRRTSFEYHVLTTRTVWSSTLASVLADTYKQELTMAARAGRERQHWAACRRGLERRAASRSGLWRA